MKYKSDYFKNRESTLKVDLTSELEPFPQNALNVAVNKKIKISDVDKRTNLANQ